MRYVEARIDDYNREEAYRFYVTDSLQLIPQNKYKVKTYKECLKPPKKQDLMTGDEIALDIMHRAGLHFEEKIDECI